MKFISVSEYALLHGVSERTVRNYCSQGKLEGAFLTGKTWNIPEDAVVQKGGKEKHIMPLLKGNFSSNGYRILVAMPLNKKAYFSFSLI